MYCLKRFDVEVVLGYFDVIKKKNAYSVCVYMYSIYYLVLSLLNHGLLKATWVFVSGFDP